MSTPHHRIHRLAAVGGAVIALAAALPVGASALVQPNPDQRAAPAAAVTAVQPNPDNRDPYLSGRVLPHTNWVTPDGGGSLPPVAYEYGPDATPAPPAKASGGTDVLVPAGFAGLVLLAGLTGAGMRRRRGAKVAA